MPQRLLVETGFGRDTHEIFLGAAKSRQNPPTRASRPGLLRLVWLSEPGKFSGSRQNPPNSANESKSARLIETGLAERARKIFWEPPKAARIRHRRRRSGSY
jgi:hypothetical protein